MASKSIIKRISRRYTVALSIIALVALVSQMTISSGLKKQRADGTIINVAGRQRTLSQRVVKAALRLNQPIRGSELAMRKAELEKALKEWIQAHHALQFGDEMLEIPKDATPPHILLAIQELTPRYDIMVEACYEILAIKARKHRSQIELLAPTEVLLANENTYLVEMNAIVKMYENMAQKKIGNLSRIELFFLLITLLTLLLEAIFIFRPATRKLSEYITQIRDNRKRLEKVLEAIPNPFVSLDENHKLRYVNQPFLNLFELDDQDIIGVPLESIIPEVGPLLVNNPAQSNGMAEHIDLEQDMLEVERPDGEKLFLMVGANAFQSASQSWVNLTFQNLTMIMNSEKVIEHQHAFIKEIAWRHSHELRKPVANILGLVELVVSGQLTSKEETENILKHLKTSAEELDQSIYQVAKSIPTSPKAPMTD